MDYENSGLLGAYMPTRAAKLKKISDYAKNSVNKMNSYLGERISPTNEAIIGGIMIPSSIVTLIVPTVVLMTAGDTYSAAFVGPITAAQIILGTIINKHGHKRMIEKKSYD